MKRRKNLPTIIIVVLASLNLSGFSQEFKKKETQAIPGNIGAGIEFVHNSELGIFGLYRYQNFVISCNLRRCTHTEKFYITPGVKYYFDKIFYGIVPLINIRYGKLHYDRSWSNTSYNYQITYVWDPAMGQMVPMVSGSGNTSSGKSVFNSPALSVSGGGEYTIPGIGIDNLAINATLGASYFTKIKGDFKEQCKFFFTVGAVYYFGKNN